MCDLCTVFAVNVGSSCPAPLVDFSAWQNHGTDFLCGTDGDGRVKCPSSKPGPRPPWIGHSVWSDYSNWDVEPSWNSRHWNKAAAAQLYQALGPPHPRCCRYCSVLGPVHKRCCSDSSDKACRRGLRLNGGRPRAVFTRARYHIKHWQCCNPHWQSTKHFDCFLLGHELR